MNDATPFTLPPECLARAQRLLESGQRTILGLVAPPGAGKSTLAEHLARALGDQAQIVPMDGFHLSNAALRTLGRQGRKGAPDTFDADGFVNLLTRLRHQTASEVIYAPEYLRSLEEGIAASLPVQPTTPFIITEGNYLLLQDGAWARVRGLLDEVWYLQVNDTLREQRLLERHIQFGKSHDQAVQWIANTDAPNARRIEETRGLADWRVCL